MSMPVTCRSVFGECRVIQNRSSAHRCAGSFTTSLSLAPWLAATPQRRGLCRTRLWSGEEFDDFFVERRGETLQDVDARSLHFALKPADVGSINFGVEGKGLLRQASRDAQAAQIPGNQLHGFHAGMKLFRCPLIHGRYERIIISFVQSVFLSLERNPVPVRRLPHC